MADGYGDVYCFNLYSEAVKSFNVNGQGSAGEIAGVEKGSSKPFWNPPQLVVSRTNLESSQLNSPLFVKGKNTIRINYLGRSAEVTIEVPGSPQSPLDQDLWLYCGWHSAMLFLPTGELLENGSKIVFPMVEK